jgi:crotonobetainyl-CoA:carnitine CoA-transferase CaiB-like acyl-CoA transferase
VLEPQEIERHPQHVARKLFFDVDGLRQTRTPFGSADGHRRPPQLGEHSADILAEAGYSPTEISALREKRVIR